MSAGPVAAGSPESRDLAQSKRCVVGTLLRLVETTQPRSNALASVAAAARYCGGWAGGAGWAALAACSRASRTCWISSRASQAARRTQGRESLRRAMTWS